MRKSVNEKESEEKNDNRKTTLLVLGLIAVLATGALAWPQPVYPELPPERLEQAPFLGSSDAAVTIIEFGDYACEACRMWHNSGVLEEILERYPGQVRYVWRENARRSTASVKAAEAAQCAFEQGMYWEYHAQLFEQTSGIGLDALVGYATHINLDMAAFRTCLTEGQMRNKVRYDMKKAGVYGFSMTPAFWVNGETIIGPPPVSYLAEIIDRKLAGE